MSTSLRNFFLEANTRAHREDETDEGYLSQSDGFLPRIPPHTHFFDSYPQLDKIIQDLPELISTGKFRHAIRQSTPVINTKQMDPRDQRRLSTTLGILVHGFVVEHLTFSDTPQDSVFRYDFDAHTLNELPPWLWNAWNDINHCNQRKETSLSFTDLVINNWQKIDPTKPRIVENLEMLIPYTRHQEERLFYMNFIETLDHSIPLLELMIQFAESLHQNDEPKSVVCLHKMDDIIRHITHITLSKINPLEYSELYCDPVRWALFVSPLSMPIRKGEVGLSGAAIPFAHLMDAFFHRGKYDTKLGRNIKESLYYMPQRHQDLFTKLHSLNIPNMVQKINSLHLCNLYQHLRQEYASTHGWLGKHRLKVYGFMDVGFRLGRSSTNGGFSGSLHERGWDELDDQLHNAQKERMNEQHYGTASVLSVQEEGPFHYTVSLDVSQIGCSFTPGDHVALVPTNSPDDIEAIRSLFDVPFKQSISCSGSWSHLASQERISLHMLLTHGQLHPFPRISLLRLYTIFPSWFIEDILEQHGEERYDLLTLLRLLQYEGYDIHSLLGSNLENLSYVIEPLQKKYYSVASFDPTHQYIDLCIRHIQYPSMDEGLIHGTASHWLVHTKPQSIPIYRVASNLFSMPTDPQTPCMMFASGSGVAPFRGFWQYRKKMNSTVCDHLFFGSRSIPLYKSEWMDNIANQTLNVHALCSREDKAWRTKEGVLEEYKRKRGYVSVLIQEESIREKLSQILTKDPLLSSTPCLYICGQGGFAKDILQALSQMTSYGMNALISFHAAGKLKLNIFTTFNNNLSKEERYSWSTIIQNNAYQPQKWMVIDGKIYDIGSYLALHPGGMRILSLYAGTDASQAFRKVGHHQSPEIRSQLDIFQIGIVHTPTFDVQWSVMIHNASPRVITIKQYYSLWVHYAQAITERENILREQEVFYDNASPIHIHTELQQSLSSENTYTKLFVEWPQELWEAYISFFDPTQHGNTYNETLVQGGYYQAFIEWNQNLHLLKHRAQTNPYEIQPLLMQTNQTQQRYIAKIKQIAREAITSIEKNEEHISALHLLPQFCAAMMLELTSIGSGIDQAK